MKFNRGDAGARRSKGIGIKNDGSAQQLGDHFQQKNKGMKLTIFILALPVMSMVSLFLTRNINGEFSEVRNALVLLYFLSSAICLGWGFYISRKSHFLGYLCVVMGIMPLLLMMWPVYSRG